MAEHTMDYIPREQFFPFHTRDSRFACIVAHRRAGKTVSCVAELITRALYTRKKNARFAYIAPFRGQAKAVAWQYLKDMTEDFAVKTRESDLRVELANGAWIQLYGSDNPDALRGIYLDGVIMDEYGDCRPSLWSAVVLPTLADRRGFAVFIGTPKSKNHFYDIYQRSRKEKNWFSLTLKVSETGLLPQEEQDEMRAQMSDETWAAEMECDFSAPVLGTYYAALVNRLESSLQIAPNACQYDPEFPVFTACDLGFTDSCSWWFWQVRPDGIAIIDYYEEQGKELAHYIDMLLSKEYNYEAIWLPHDAKARTLQTGRSTVEQLLEPSRIDERFEGVRLPCRIVPSLSIQHGIDAARLVLPKCYIDADRCADGIEALRGYRRRFDETRNVLSDQPLHDWCSHGADAFRYMALAVKDFIHDIKPFETRNNVKNLNYLPEKLKLMSTYTLDDLHEARAAQKSRNTQRI